MPVRARQLPPEREMERPVEPKPLREVEVPVDVRDPDVPVEVVREGLDVLRKAVVGAMVEVLRPEE